MIDIAMGISDNKIKNNKGSISECPQVETNCMLKLGKYVFSKQELYENHCYTWCYLFYRFVASYLWKCVLLTWISHFTLLSSLYRFTIYYTNIFTQDFADSRLHLDPMGKMWSRAEEIKGKKGEGARENSTLHHDNRLKYHWSRNAPEGDYLSDNTEELHESNISRATDGKSENFLRHVKLMINHILWNVWSTYLTGRKTMKNGSVDSMKIKSVPWASSIAIEGTSTWSSSSLYTSTTCKRQSH